MLQKCIMPLKSLLVIFLVLSLVLMVQPAEALAADVKYKVTCTSAGNGKVVAAYDSEGKELDWYEAGEVWNARIPSGAVVDLKKLRDPDKVEPESGYEIDYWIADKDLYYNGGWGFIGHAALAPRGSELRSSLSSYYVYAYEDLTLTAHFKRKPVTVSYATDGNGTVSMASQEVQCASTLSLGSDPTKELTVGQPRYEVDATPNNNFRLSYWTASEDVYVLDVLTMQLLVYSAGTPLPNEDIDLYYVLEDTTYTAHFLRTMYDITYESAGHGLVSLAAESVAVGSNPAGCTVTPDDGYDFEYWTANVDVEVAEESANLQAATLTASNAESEAATTTIAAGDPITDEQLKRAVSFSDDPVFTAHFKQVSSKTPSSDAANNSSDDADNTTTTTTTSVTSNSSNSNNSGSTSATSAASQAGSNLAPAMGDALFGVTVVAILCAGVTAALAALFRKRKS